MGTKTFFSEIGIYSLPVSYTHLDVYKRQPLHCPFVPPPCSWGFCLLLLLTTSHNLFFEHSLSFESAFCISLPQILMSSYFKFYSLEEYHFICLKSVTVSLRHKYIIQLKYYNFSYFFVILCYFFPLAVLVVLLILMVVVVVVPTTVVAIVAKHDKAVKRNMNDGDLEQSRIKQSIQGLINNFVVFLNLLH